MHFARYLAFDDHTLCLMAHSAVYTGILEVQVTAFRKGVKYKAQQKGRRTIYHANRSGIHQFELGSGSLRGKLAGPRRRPSALCENVVQQFLSLGLRPSKKW